MKGKEAALDKKDDKEVLKIATKKVLMLKGQSDVRDRRIALEGLFGGSVEMVQIGQVDSVDRLKQLIADNPEVVMIEAEILPNLILAEILLTTDIYENIQIRQSQMIQSRGDDKETINSDFWKYLRPLTGVVFE
ncbi:MAG: hypothetical protein PHX84_02690 [Candidatus Shapirobacteria bacterium]|jgi:hypothetical protein|nr:hypothetical protein [Candidatus Shapirobacteria bacterium]